MRATLDGLVRSDKKPVMGVCVGMQILTDSSDEGTSEGLGWIPGRTRALADQVDSGGLPLPHMGWNDVEPESQCPLFQGLDGDARFYFLHSYYVEPTSADDTVAITGYGLRFASAVRRGNVWGVQFHPEKSHHWGATLLKNFATV
jgi:glutamine amidotransferase